LKAINTIGEYKDQKNYVTRQEFENEIKKLEKELEQQRFELNKQFEEKFDLINKKFEQLGI
jgi:uncharacterized membrane-anchored protein YhcB (DUF1043 family)